MDVGLFNFLVIDVITIFYFAAFSTRRFFSAKLIFLVAHTLRHYACSEKDRANLIQDIPNYNENKQKFQHGI